MKVLELFAGSRSFSKVAEERFNCKTFSIDIEPFEGISLVKDIEFLKRGDIPFTPDIIWASPPCTTYSVAAISTHRDGIKPKSDFAIKSDKLLENTVYIIQRLLIANPLLLYFIENPVGMMRKMPIMKQFDRATVTYCRYGDMRMKPTDIWTNSLSSWYNPYGWNPRPRCFNGNSRCRHEKAPRGSKTGTQGLVNDYERSKVPESLCIEILSHCINKSVCAVAKHDNPGSIEPCAESQCGMPKSSLHFA